MRDMKQRVVISAADHGQKLLLLFSARLGKRFHHRRSAVGGSVRIHQFGVNRNSAFFGNRLDQHLRSLSSPHPDASRSVSRISTLIRTRLGMLLTAPGNTSQIPTVATVSIAPLVRAAFSIARINSAAAHSASWRSGIKHSARVSACSFNRDFQARRRCNVRSPLQAESAAAPAAGLVRYAIQQTPCSSRAGNFTSASSPAIPAWPRTSSSVLPSPSFNRLRRFCRKTPGKQSAAQAANPKTRRLFRSKNQQLDRMLRTKAALLQCTYGFQASQHSHDAIVFPCVGDRVDVRTGADRGRFGIGTVPARESIADWHPDEP